MISLTNWLKNRPTAGIPATSGTYASTGIPYIYEGVPIHARGLTLAAIYASTWSPPSPAPSGSPWTEYGHVPNTWRHRAFPGHILWKPTAHLVFVAHLSTSSSAPKLATVEALAHLALGATLTPISVATYPLTLRLPVLGPGELVLPQERFRCRRLWPSESAPAHVEAVETIPIELRISATGEKGSARLCAEVFVGRAHVVTKVMKNNAGKPVKTQKPRAMVFSGDARHLLLVQNPRAAKRFTARLMDA